MHHDRPIGSVGFAGLGRMGAPMASRLLASGLDLGVHNRTAARCEPLAAGGAAVAGSPAELAADRDLVVTMLAGPAAVRDTVTQMLETARPGTILVDMSTAGPDVIRMLAGQAAERGVHLVDAPVSGSVPAAQSGSLVVMAGGAESALRRAMPVLSLLASRVLHLGPSGAGATMKLAVNGVLAAFNAAVAEALVLAERAGIAREAAYDTLACGAMAAPYLAYKRDAFLAPDGASVAFTIDGLHKDVALALEVAVRSGTPSPMASAAATVLAGAAAAGLGEHDIAAVLGWLAA